jgi:hypothetical protein
MMELLVSGHTGKAKKALGVILRSVALRVGHGMRIFENRVLGRIFGQRNWNHD